MFFLRARFKREIIVEFLPPKKPSKKVIIFCDGMPSLPYKRDLMEFFHTKGYWVFHPRYRGSWESGGSFLKKSPHEDIIDVLGEISKGFTSLWDGVRYQVVPEKVTVIGVSFGGAAALLSSNHPRVSKVIAIAPVVDWKSSSKAEPFDWFYKVVKESFGEAYRGKKKDWNKLKTGAFYNPMAHWKQIDAKKIFVVHAQDDDVVSFSSVKKFVNKIRCQSVFLKSGGHLSSKIILQKRIYKKVKEFLK